MPSLHKSYFLPIHNPWQELGGFETAIQNAKHQLELLGIAIEDKKVAIATLVDLRKSGIYEREILQVVETIRSKNNGHDRNFELDAYMDSPKPTSPRRS
jgi:hypothetical protein